MTDDEASPLEEPVYSQYDHLLRAIKLAHEIRDDLKVSGPLAQYAAYLEGKAVNAMALLIKADPGNTAAIMQVQRDIGAYAHLYGWLDETQSEAANAEIAWEEAKSTETYEE